MQRALIVEDERPIRELLRLHLQAAGFDVQACVEGTAALRVLREDAFALIVLDVMLPGLDGVSICRAVRAAGPNTASPILMVTARDAESDKVIGLESGADDYVAKPFGVHELMARVMAITRRHKRAQSPDGGDAIRYSAGPLQLDAERRVAAVRGQPVELTRQEFDLLHRLISESAGINRRGVVNERVIRRRASDSRRPRVMRRRP
jgi:DNA-binding response OmpR family regulator